MQRFTVRMYGNKYYSCRSQIYSIFDQTFWQIFDKKWVNLLVVRLLPSNRAKQDIIPDCFYLAANRSKVDFFKLKKCFKFYFLGLFTKQKMKDGNGTEFYDFFIFLGLFWRTGGSNTNLHKRSLSLREWEYDCVYCLTFDGKFFSKLMLRKND